MSQVHLLQVVNNVKWWTIRQCSRADVNSRGSAIWLWNSHHSIYGYHRRYYYWANIQFDTFSNWKKGYGWGSEKLYFHVSIDYESGADTFQVSLLLQREISYDNDSLVNERSYLLDRYSRVKIVPRMKDSGKTKTFDDFQPMIGFTLMVDPY